MIRAIITLAGESFVRKRSTRRIHACPEPSPGGGFNFINRNCCQYSVKGGTGNGYELDLLLLIDRFFFPPFCFVIELSRLPDATESAVPRRSRSRFLHRRGTSRDRFPVRDVAEADRRQSGAKTLSERIREASREKVQTRAARVPRPSSVGNFDGPAVLTIFR